jgi:hypothetical protein
VKNRYSIWQLLVALAVMALLPMAAQAQDVNHRLADQHARIRQGIASGQLTRRETRNLRHRDARISARVRRDRRVHGGRLTSGERRRLNRSLNRTSRAIYRGKHNGAVR